MCLEAEGKNLAKKSLVPNRVLHRTSRNSASMHEKQTTHVYIHMYIIYIYIYVHTRIGNSSQGFTKALAFSCNLAKRREILG